MIGARPLLCTNRTLRTWEDGTGDHETVPARVLESTSLLSMAGLFRIRILAVFPNARTEHHVFPAVSTFETKFSCLRNFVSLLCPPCGVPSVISNSLNDSRRIMRDFEKDFTVAFQNISDRNPEWRKPCVQSALSKDLHDLTDLTAPWPIDPFVRHSYVY